MKSNSLMKKHYSETLLAMCEEQPLSTVTVAALVKRAGTAKQTFYNHFKDLNDLVNYIPRNYMIASGFIAFSPSAISKAYRYASEHKGFFSALAQHSGQNNFRDEFIAFGESAGYAKFIHEGLSKEESFMRTLAIDLFTIGVVDHFLEWCRTGLAWDPETLARVHALSAPEFMQSNADEVR